MRLHIVTFILAVSLAVIKCSYVCDPCPSNCEFGTIEIEENGTCRCACLVDPCKTLKCQNGKICVVRKCARENKCKLYSRASCVSPIKKSKEKKILPDKCQKPMDIGPCKASVKRFFYNQTSQQCQQFTFGGCKGNENNFVTSEQCNTHCTNAHLLQKKSDDVDVCSLEREVGPCKAAHKRYFFNSTSQQCQRFTYGGCRGNKNNFHKMEDCNQKCGNKTTSNKLVEVFEVKPKSSKNRTENKCTGDKDQGRCRGYFRRYFYNKTSQACENFIYGGCGGNENNFEAIEECISECGANNNQSSDSVRETGDKCQLDSVTGPCRGHFPRYFFNKTSQTCEQFIYGGCEGNENNFEKKDECVSQCGGGTNDDTRHSDVCSLAQSPGNCYGYFEKYFFNSTSQKCEKFVYGGCGGNKNRFDTIDDCQKRCESSAEESTIDKCKLFPPTTGVSCMAYLERYFYNSTSSQCEMFIYGGCGGNENNFLTVEACQKGCGQGA